MKTAMTTPEPSRLDLAVDAETIRLSGIIDAHTAEQLLDGLRTAATDSDTVADLGGVDFIDSSGLRALVTVHQEHVDAGGRLLLRNLSQPVTRLLEITGLSDHLHVDQESG